MLTTYCHILIASGNAILAAGFLTSSSRSQCTNLVHHHHSHHPSPRSLCPPTVSLHATTSNNDNDNNNKSSMIDPSNIIYKHDSAYLPKSSSSNENGGGAGEGGWGIGDDWTSLSSSATPSSTSTNFDFTKNNYDSVIDEAAHILEEQESLLSEWEASEENGDDSSSKNKDKDMTYYVTEENEDFVDSAIEVIASNMDYNEADGVALYDTKQSSSSAADVGNAVASISNNKKESKEYEEEDEMAFMIRCNQSPEQFLISQGRAIPELTDEMKYSPNFLVEKADDELQKMRGDDSLSLPLPLQPKSTPFFEAAVEKIFNTHSVQVHNSEEDRMEVVLDRNAIAKWMTACISSPFTAVGVEKELTSSQHYGPHDPSISAILSRYSQTHGSGRLTLDEFQTLYLEVTWAGYNRDIYNKKIILDSDTYYQIPAINAGAIIQGRKNTEKILQKASLDIIWRDLEAHGIFSPAEEEQVQLIQEMERLQASVTAANVATSKSELLMDECELFEDYTDRLSHQISYSDDNDDDMLGAESQWDFLTERKEKSSHELVEFAYDGKTPKRIRDGQFVFIDEETCIGCTQCAQISPSSFKMIDDTGRARTYSQSNTIDVENAVMACPVNCMHFMSFDELKEMELARDDGDGRDDHRHFGGRVTHTPLFVGGIDSDANHKSSWYHYLKQKCHGK